MATVGGCVGALIAGIAIGASAFWACKRRARRIALAQQDGRVRLMTGAEDENSMAVAATPEE